MKLALFATAAALFWAVSIAGLAYAHGPAEWIMVNPDIEWCCSEKDCVPADGRVSYGEDGYFHVEGLSGRKRDGDSGFYRLPHIDRPWVCALPGTNELRCLMMPEVEG
jgi:hypothetical protein